MKRLPLGQMAKLNRVSEKALRIYHEKGILVPDFVDEDTGRRYYDVQQSTKLDMILQLQQMGFSLGEIAKINEMSDIAHLQRAAEERRARIAAQRQQLALAQRLTEQLIEGCARFSEKPLLDQIMLEEIPERHILKFPVPEPEKLQARSNLDNAEQWEIALRKVRQEIHDRGWPLAVFGNTGTIIARESIEGGLPEKSHIFVYVTPEYGDCYGEAETLPGGPHLTLYLGRAYEGGHELDTGRIERMHDYARKKGFSLAGDSFGESICRYPRFFNQGDDLLYRLCMPVRRVEG